MENKNALKFIRLVAGKDRSYLYILLLVHVVLDASSIFNALILRNLIDAAVAGQSVSFFKAVVLLASLVIFQIILRAVNRHTEEAAKSAFENRFKYRLFDTLLKKDYSAISATHSGEWMNRLTSDTTVVAEGLATIVPGVAGMAVKIVGTIVMIFVMVPFFGAILVPFGILLAVLTYGFRKHMKKLHKEVQETDGKLRVFLQERLSSLLILKTFEREDLTAHEANIYMGKHREIRLKRVRFSNICNIGFGCAMHGAYVLAAFYCGYGLLTRTISYGTLTATLQLVNQIQSPFANITGFVPKYYSMVASAERLQEVEALADDLADSIIKRNPEEIRSFYEGRFAGIRMEHVTFTYPENLDNSEPLCVLNDFYLDIKKGEICAFTGASGSGKSTILKLLFDLYHEQSGLKYLYDIDENKISLDASWRGLFSYVPQGNQLLSGSIREVVTFATEQASDKEVWKALEIACASEFVSALPDGLDTMLGEHGQGLSEGQMQRLAIARAVYSQRPILVLDEATASLDASLEQHLLENIKNMTNQTVLIVTHRPAALAICNRQFEIGEV